MASMVDCKKIQGQLSAYIDSELPSEDHWDVRLHLASCAVCARAHRELCATVSLIQGLPALNTSSGFEEALARRLADQALRPRRSSPAEWLQERLQMARELPRLRPALAAAGALAVLAPAVVFLVNAQQPEDEPAISSLAVRSHASHKEQQFVDVVLEEHASFAGAIPLSDDSALMLSASRDKGARN